MELDQGAFNRAWTDLKLVTHHWWRFRVPAGLLTAGFAVWSTLAPHASPLGRGALAVGGTLGGALLVGLVAFGVLVATAPLRQRNEARGQLKRLTPEATDDPKALADQFSDWVLAKRAALPTGAVQGSPFGPPGLSLEDSAKAQFEFQKSLAERTDAIGRVQTQARIEYHERFRKPVQTVLGEPHTDLARDPKSIDDFEALERLLARRAAARPELSDWLRDREEELRDLEVEIGRLASPNMNSAKLEKCRQARGILGGIDAEVTRRLQREARDWVDYFNEQPDWYDPAVLAIGQDEPMEVIGLLAFKADQIAHIIAELARS